MSTLRLLKWLGPWTDQRRAPRNIHREAHTVADGNETMEMWVYKPTRKATGAIFVLPGIHYEGPADVRLDRFCRVLANAGMQVGCPFLPTMIDLVMTKGLLRESSIALRAFLELIPGQKVGVFGISAASVAALHLGSAPEFDGKVHTVHLFGGFSNWSEALVFSMTGDLSTGGRVEIDPLGLPVVFLNLQAAIEGMPTEGDDLNKAWRGFVEQTWEKPEMQKRAQYESVALELATRLPESQRTLFLQGCSIEEGGISKAISAVAQYNQDVDWLDPKSALHKLHCDLYISHGRDDSVVPFTQAEQLQQWCPAVKRKGVFVTGLVHHTGVVSLWTLLRLLPKLPMELLRSLQMVRAIARTGRG